MDYFFAQIEEIRRPMIKEKIIAVCIFSGKTEDSGVVSSVNYLGRSIGIKSGMPIVFAKKIAPKSDSLFIPADREYYAQISSYIDELIRNHYSKVAQASIDEWNVFGDENGALDLKKAIKDATGLTCTIGIANSIIGAKMAAKNAKPNGFLIVDNDFVQNSKIEKVPGIGKKTADALNQLGVFLVKDLKKIDPGYLVEVFGKKTGSWFHKLSIGEFDKDLEEEKEADEISRIGTLKVITRDVGEIINKIDNLENNLKKVLIEMKKSYRTITLIFITDDFKMHTKSHSFSHPKGWDADNFKEKNRLIIEFLGENNKKIRRVGIKYSHFFDFKGQTTLF